MQCTCGPDSPDDPCGPDGPDGNDGLGGTDGPGEGTLVRGPTCQGLLGLVYIVLSFWDVTFLETENSQLTFKSKRF